MAHLFEQQARESNKAFAAFSLYLSLGPERSLAAVGQRLGKSVSLVERWSAKFDWPARVRAYEEHLARVEREATEAVARGKSAEWLTRREEHKQTEWALRGELTEAGRRVLANFTGGLRGATLGDVARALELASKLGRLASGLATETVEHTGELDVHLRLEVEAAVRKAYGDVVDAESWKELPDGRA